MLLIRITSKRSNQYEENIRLYTKEGIVKNVHCILKKIEHNIIIVIIIILKGLRLQGDSL
jgi:hypothetical protein